MAIQALIPTLINASNGRTLYKLGSKFISKKKYDLLNRRDFKTGRFISKAKAAQRGSLQEIESRLISKLGGRPPRGLSWAWIADKYEERFDKYLR